MRTLTLRAQAKPTLSLRCSLQNQHGLWHAHVLDSLVSVRSRSTRPLSVCTACSVHTGFHQQRLAADVRTGTKGADFKPLDVEIRSDSSACDPPTVCLLLHLLLYHLVMLRETRTDHELQAVGWLRARSFYAYPPERAFAGQVRCSCSTLVTTFVTTDDNQRIFHQCLF